MKRHVIYALCAVTTLSVFGQQASQHARLQPLPPAQARSAAQKIAASKSGTDAIPETDNGQNFVLRAAGADDLILLAGELSAKNDGKSLHAIEMQCGLFTLDSKGSTRYVSVIGPDYKPYSWCEQLNALGTADDSGPRPRMIAEFYLRALSGDHYNAPFVLMWNPATSTYQVDTKASIWLVQQHGTGSVAGARRALARYRP